MRFLFEDYCFKRMLMRLFNWCW